LPQGTRRGARRSPPDQIAGGSRSRQARTFSDREVGFTGLATGRAAAVYITGIPLAAMALAQHTHAPNLTILLAGWSHDPDLEALHALPDLEFDERLRDLPCEAQAFDYPGQFSLKRGDGSPTPSGSSSTPISPLLGGATWYRPGRARRSGHHARRRPLGTPPGRHPTWPWWPARQPP
jgi:hypothetical protein